MQKLYEENSVSAIADAIRTKGGSGTFTVGDMAQAVLDISSGGEWTTKGLADGSEPNGDLDLEDCTTIAPYAFAHHNNFTSVAGYSVSVIHLYAFQGCSGLQRISFPNIESAWEGAGMFADCTALTSVDLPKLKSVANLVFARCRNLQFLDFPSLQRLNYSGVMRDCNKLNTLILRHSAVVPINGDVFANTPFTGYQGQTADLYVPQALISEYENATNWSALFANGYISIHAIEGSQYE